jgi:hypothetical protein
LAAKRAKKQDRALYATLATLGVAAIACGIAFASRHRRRVSA